MFEVVVDHGLSLEPHSRLFWECFRRRPAATGWVMLNRRLTVKDVFDACGLSPMLRAVLYGHGGIFAAGPEAVSFLAYATGSLLYHRGCYYPVHDMDGFVAALTQTIENGRGRVLRNQRVTAVKTGPGGVESVTTQTGETWAADAVVVNFDPRTFLKMIDRPAGNGIPQYSYSGSVNSFFFGVTDAEVLKPGLGNWNVWYSAGSEPAPGMFDAAPGDSLRFLYLNSPSLVKGTGNDAPPGHATVTAFSPCGYRAFTQASPEHRQAMTERQTAQVIDLIDRRFAPGLKQRLAVTHVRTPLDKERVWIAPEGNIYGRSLGPRDVWVEVPWKGLLPNLYFVGAYVSFPGIASVIQGACRLYRELTGDSV
jgi:phytoene dehydrogenase-like protein